MNDLTLVKMENLKTHFPVRAGLLKKTIGHVKAVDGISLEIKKGEIIAIVGESGCGKSTLGNAIPGLTRPTAGQLFLENIKIDITKASSWKPFHRDFQIVFQDPLTALNPRHTIYETLAEPLLIHKIGKRKNLRDAVAILLEKVGLSVDYMNRYPHAFSGGQRQRICIARSIAPEPKLIVCDEVTAALDVSVQAQIIELLLNLKNEMGLSLLFISHDLSIIKAISKRIHVMYLGKIVESAPTGDLFRNPAHPYTRALLNSIPSLNRAKKPEILQGEIPSPVNIPTGCAFHTRCRLVKERCRNEIPAIESKNERDVACFYPD